MKNIITLILMAIGAYTVYRFFKSGKKVSVDKIGEQIDSAVDEVINEVQKKTEQEPIEQEEATMTVLSSKTLDRQLNILIPEIDLAITEEPLLSGQYASQLKQSPILKMI